MRYQIIDHGCDGESYFPGCGVAFTSYTDCVTGIGDSAYEAGQDALEQIATGYDLDPADLATLEAVCANLDKTPDARGSQWSHTGTGGPFADDWHHYISIRWTFGA